MGENVVTHSLQTDELLELRNLFLARENAALQAQLAEARALAAQRNLETRIAARLGVRLSEDAQFDLNKGILQMSAEPVQDAQSA